MDRGNQRSLSRSPRACHHAISIICSHSEVNFFSTVLIGNGVGNGKRGSTWELAIPGKCLIAQIDALGGCVAPRSAILEDRRGTILLTPREGLDGLPYGHAKPCPLLLQTKGNIDEIKVAAATLIADDTGAVLLTRRAREMRSFPDVWVPPGGTIRPKESLEESARRESKEEIDVTVGELHPICFWESAYPPYPWAAPVVRQHLVMYFAAKTSDRSPIEPSWEVEDWVWLSRDDVLSLANRISETVRRVITEKTHQALSLPDLLPDPRRKRGMTQGTYFALQCFSRSIVLKEWLGRGFLVS